jgi:hypothetical protein
MADIERSAFAAVPLVSLAALLLSVACPWSPPRGSFHEKVVNAAADGESTVALDVARERGWQTAYFFGPHSTEAEMNRILGFRCETCALVDIGERDDIDILVLVKGSEGIRVEEVPRRDIEIAPDLLGRPFPPGTMFRLRAINGRLTLQRASG